MEIYKIKFKAGNIEGKEKKESYFIKTIKGYIPIRIMSEAIIEQFGEIIEIKEVYENAKGELITEK